MALIYNYILAYDTDENMWFHNVDAESNFMDGKTVYNPDHQEYIHEYQGDDIYLSETDRLMIIFNKIVDKLNKGEKI